LGTAPAVRSRRRAPTSVAAGRVNPPGRGSRDFPTAKGHLPHDAGIAAIYVRRAYDVVGPKRRQILLVTVAAVIGTAEIVHEGIWSYAGQEYVGAATLALLAIAVAIAVLRYGLYEIDLIVSRTFVFGSLTLILGGAYLAVVATTGLIIPGRGLDAIPAAVLVARRRQRVWPEWRLRTNPLRHV